MAHADWSECYLRRLWILENFITTLCDVEDKFAI